MVIVCMSGEFTNKLGFRGKQRSQKGSVLVGLREAGLGGGSNRGDPGDRSAGAGDCVGSAGATNRPEHLYQTGCQHGKPQGANQTGRTSGSKSATTISGIYSLGRGSVLESAKKLPKNAVKWLTRLK